MLLRTAAAVMQMLRLAAHDLYEYKTLKAAGFTHDTSSSRSQHPLRIYCYTARLFACFCRMGTGACTARSAPIMRICHSFHAVDHRYQQKGLMPIQSPCAVCASMLYWANVSW